MTACQSWTLASGDPRQSGWKMDKLRCNHTRKVVAHTLTTTFHVEASSALVWVETDTSSSRTCGRIVHPAMSTNSGEIS